MNRRLVDEPLSAEDWSIVYALLCGFQAAVEVVVQNARKRDAETEVE